MGIIAGEQRFDGWGFADQVGHGHASALSLCSRDAKGHRRRQGGVGRGDHHGVHSVEQRR